MPTCLGHQREAEERYGSVFSWSGKTCLIAWLNLAWTTKGCGQTVQDMTHEHSKFKPKNTNPSCSNRGIWYRQSFSNRGIWYRRFTSVSQAKVHQVTASQTCQQTLICFYVCSSSLGFPPVLEGQLQCGKTWTISPMWNWFPPIFWSNLQGSTWYIFQSIRQWYLLPWLTQSA